MLKSENHTCQHKPERKWHTFCIQHFDLDCVDENVLIFIKIPLKGVPKGPINKTQQLSMSYECKFIQLHLLYKPIYTSTQEPTCTILNKCTYIITTYTKQQHKHVELNLEISTKNTLQDLGPLLLTWLHWDKGMNK